MRFNGPFRTPAVLSLSAALLLSLSACAPAAPPAPTATAPAERASVKVANLPFIAFAPFYIGIEQGYFTAQGIDVELVNFATQPDTLAALASGSVDVVAGQISAGYLNFVARTSQAHVVSDKGYIDANACDNIAFVGRPGIVGSDGRVTADALRGQKSNVVQGTWNEYMVDKILGPLGLTMADLDNVEIPPAAHPAAMQSGQLALAATNEPWVTRLLDDGNKAVQPAPHELLPDSQSAVTMYGPKLLNNTDLGTRFMVAYLQATRQYNQGHTEQNLNTLTKYTQLDRGVLDKMCWPALRGDGSVNVDSLLDFQNWAMAKGLQASALSRQQMWDSTFTTAAVGRLGKQ
jgi:ABC-type nitrate/sulfonate/bicarbonate transport system substrate-binding protein